MLRICATGQNLQFGQGTTTEWAQNKKCLSQGQAFWQKK